MFEKEKEKKWRYKFCPLKMISHCFTGVQEVMSHITNHKMLDIFTLTHMKYTVFIFLNTANYLLAMEIHM